MARGFKRKRGRFVAELDPTEREIVIDVLARTADLLDDGRGRAAAAPGGSGDSGDPGGQSGGGTDGPDDFEAMMRRAGLTDDPDAAPPPAPQVSDDPAVRRLIPDGHRDDPEAAAAFRAMSARNVRDVKLAHLERAVAALGGPGPIAPDVDGRVDLAEDDAVALLRALTDVRLVLAERLELRSDEDVEHLEAQLAALRAGDARAQAMLAYDFLTWWQETLAAALLPG